MTQAPRSYEIYGALGSPYTMKMRAVLRYRRPYAQGTFKYQVKCLAELRRRLAALEGGTRVQVEAVLKETGCLAALT